MVITIQSRSFSLTPALKTFIEGRMNFILARYGEKVSRIYVTLLDINGPKGGMDKRCRVLVKLDGCAPIILQETQEDLYDAILACGSRLRRIISRKLSHKKRGPRYRPVVDLDQMHI